jgi:hypothetical protein
LSDSANTLLIATQWPHATHIKARYLLNSRL